MRLIADLHSHSKYAISTSEQMVLGPISAWAARKGIGLVGTGDFSHPKWFTELKSKLTDWQHGFALYGSTRFVLSNEVSCVWNDGRSKTRTLAGTARAHKVHCILLAPDLEVVAQLNERFARWGKLGSDGRPQLKVGCPELVETCHSVSPAIEVIPAHSWTPWFGVVGENSGFDTVRECFQDQTPRIHALETGLSADPEMFWRVSSLDRFLPISNSDAHSPQTLGREVNVLELPTPSYGELISALRTKDRKRFLYTLETFPPLGKYHNSGHRAHKVSVSGKRSLQLKGVCPKCGKKMTIGVEHRVEELADRPPGHRPKGAIPFKHFIPLDDLLGAVFKVGPASKRVQTEYERLVGLFGSEFAVLEAKEDELQKMAGKSLSKAISRVRSERVKLVPGYDGVYGRVVF